MLDESRHSTGMARQSQALYADQARLQKLKTKPEDPESLRQIAKEFESIFIQMALKAMREANKPFESEVLSSHEREHYQDMHDSQLAFYMSQHGNLGISDAIYRQMSRQAPISQQPQVDKTLPAPSLKPAIIPKPVLAASPAAPLTPVQFVQQHYPLAQQAAAQLGVDPKVLLAQSALETGWGQHVPKGAHGQSSHNYFGIKASQPKDKHVIAKTSEYTGNTPRVEKAKFRAYNSQVDSYEDYVRKIQSDKRYREALKVGKDATTYVQALQDAGYATDPEYATKIMRIYRSQTLAHLTGGGTKPAK